MSTVTNTNNAAANSVSSNPAQAQQGLNSNFQDFLTLLTTQLQNQDPTQPADVNQMTQEIATLSQVEQQINGNTLLQQMVTLLGSSQVNDAVGYIGKQVDATGNQLALSGGQAQLDYMLPAGVSTANVTITNSAGAVVFSGPGTTVSGRNQVVWNGVNSVTGSTAPAGNYTFAVTAKDANGATMTATPLTTGVVTAVDSQNGTNTLSLGGLSVPISSVQSVYNPGTNPGA